jgi:hypothetical protein
MKRAKTLKLCRETLHPLEDAELTGPVGGIEATRKTNPTSPTQLVCTLTCPCA